MASDYLDPLLAAQVEAPVGLDEFTRRVRAPLTDDERAEVEQLVRWFTRRYPTVKQRLAYARRKFAQWTRPVRVLPRDRADGD